MTASDVEVLGGVAQTDPVAWNRLAGDNPFLRHEFLAGLERHGCVGERFGWLPRPLIARDAGGRLAGAVALYLKHNTYGEFVFDWAWADAYARAGKAYYPKLVAALPYTPATGPRLLVAPDVDRERVAAALLEGAIDYAREAGVSSLHWLFPSPRDLVRLRRSGLLLRMDCHFHWTNRGWHDFDEYLSALSSRKRKKIRQERRRVAESGVAIEEYAGDEMSDAQWGVLAEFYASTFRRRGAMPTLNLPFFREVGPALGRRVFVVLARHRDRYVAGSIAFASDDTLYGRHWGCREAFHGLHFEACYYRGIEYCLRHGLRRFEPGVQGEHKVSRGFLPTPTWSAHWFAHPAFETAIADFLGRERRMIADYCAELARHSPFKSE
ncbi:MAG: N-acetyltransferase [Gammaproteobacteria bacterium]|nr:N-acetyltransferase [Gammaproteobacteria bacterium]